jgi:hypothetical protein
MPWGIERIYENRSQFLQEQNRALVQENKSESRDGKASNEERSERGEKAEQAQQHGMQQARGNTGESHGEGRGERKVKREEKPAVAAPLTDLAPIVTAVQAEWKTNPISTINIIAPNTDQAKIELRALHGESVAYRNVYASMQFDGVTGKNLTDDSAKLKHPSVPMGIYNVVTTLHEARGVDLALRWLLFISGIVGTLMVATGLILWCVKRAPQQQKQGFKSLGYRTVEVTNIAAIIGLPIACAAFFYANRFIPAEMEMRSNWEIRCFFIVWLMTFIYAMFRTHRQAWLELLAFATIVFALLPIVNFMTGGQALWNSIAHGQWVIASFDLAMWLLAALFAYSFYKVKKHQGLPVKKARPVKETTT